MKVVVNVYSTSESLLTRHTKGIPKRFRQDVCMLDAAAGETGYAFIDGIGTRHEFGNGTVVYAVYQPDKTLV